METILYKAFIIAALWFIHPGEPSHLHAVTPIIRNGHDQELIAGRFDSLFTVLATKKGFNGNVLVSHNGAVLYEHAFGYSNLKRKTPLTIGSEFQLASVSKQFTSAAIMMLRDRGKLDFNDTLQKYFPDFPYQNITIRQLLSHRSGLPNYMYFASKYWKNKTGFLSNADVIDMLTKYKPAADFAPDQGYRYSNTGYAILASIVEKVSGLKFDEFMQQDVFQPLGMENSYVFNPNKIQGLQFQTTGHNKNCRPVFDDYMNGVVGDKGVYSAVEDMFKWDQALYTEQLVKQSTLEEAFTPISYDYKHGSNYGFGWRIKLLEDGTKVVYHTGWWKGYNSMFVRRLEDKTSIVVLSNKVNWSFRNIGELFGLFDSTSIDATAMGGD